MAQVKYSQNLKIFLQSVNGYKPLIDAVESHAVDEAEGVVVIGAGGVKAFDDPK
jgi:hypothetical protein